MIKFCWWRHGQKLWHHKLFIKNTFILKRPRVAIFADIIKVVTIFIKTIFKDSKKFKRIRNYSQSSVFIYFSSCNKICRFLVKKCWCQQISRGVLRDSHDFWIFFRYNCTKFHHCRLYMTGFKKGEHFCPTSVNNPKKAHPK